MKPAVPLRIAAGRYTPFLRPGWGGAEEDAVHAWQRGDDLPGAASELASAAVAAGGGGAVVPMASGRAALRAVLASAKLPVGSEVVLPTYCCAAVAEAVRETGHRPVLADVDDELNLTLDSVMSVASAETRAVIVVHLGGVPAADGPAIAEWASAREWFVVEDSAQSVPGVGLGDVTIHSTGPGKVLFGPGGGWVRTDEDRAAEVSDLLGPLAPRHEVEERLARFLHRYRLRPSGVHDLRVRLGDRRSTDWHHGVRTTDLVPISGIDAAVAVAQLRRVDDIVDRRRAHAARWRQLLADARVPLTMAADPGAACKVWVRSSGDARPLSSALWRSGVEVEQLYRPLHLDPRWSAGQRGPLATAEDLAPRVVALPCRPDLTAADWRRIERAVQRLGAHELDGRRGGRR